uniref:polynucleotide adenylyltransferase n=1 Tax=Meloidogyne hapla TaxID=6305 RepID=A0A1I8BT58_MELHA
MIIGGSQFLETAGPDSDLDIIFVFPQKCLCPLPNILGDCEKCQRNGNIRFCTKHDQFFGSNVQSFASYLRNEIYSVENIEEFEFRGYSISGAYINSIENARVPIISISISGVEMDIMAAPIPYDNIPDNFDLINIENENIVNKNNKLLNELIGTMIKQNDQFYNKSILVLTGYRIAYNTKSKFIQSAKQLSLFVDLMRAVKLWAKRKQIYSNVFGYLSGTILTIMTAKINLKFNNSGGLIFLFKQFFKVYSEWQWPFPVLLEPLTTQDELTQYLNKENNYLIDSWNLSNIKNDIQPSIMPIISPQFPEQNVAFNVNEFTKSIILREMKKASNYFKNINSKNLTKEWWQKTIFEQINYKLIYKHFIMVICTVPIKTKENINNFKCGLLKTKLRLIFKEWAGKIRNNELEEYHSISGFEKERRCERIK